MPSDVCKKCDGCGKLIDRHLRTVTCPVCEGIGWDPESIQRELKASKDSIENIKL